MVLLWLLVQKLQYPRVGWCWFSISFFGVFSHGE